MRRHAYRGGCLGRRVKRLLAVPLLLATALAGCAGPPDVPPEAAHAKDPRLPGLSLDAWTTQDGGLVRLHAVAVNGGEAEYPTKEDCGYLWQSEIRDENGTRHEYRAPREEVCDWFYDFLYPDGYREFLHSWDGRFWEGGEAAAALAGDYTWTVRFLLRDGADHETLAPVEGRFLEAVVPVRVG